MCLFKKPKLPKAEPLAVVDPNAGKPAAEADMQSRAKASGFASTLLSTPQSRATGSVASKILFGM
jgi:hypothetical protein